MSLWKKQQRGTSTHWGSIHLEAERHVPANLALLSDAKQNGAMQHARHRGLNTQRQDAA